MMTETIPLHLLPIGQTAHVEHITGESATSHRLKELGFHEGSIVEMVQSGSACIVRVGGHKLGFRADEAANVFVRRTIAMGVAG